MIRLTNRIEIPSPGTYYSTRMSITEPANSQSPSNWGTTTNVSLYDNLGGGSTDGVRTWGTTRSRRCLIRFCPEAGIDLTWTKSITNCRRVSSQRLGDAVPEPAIDAQTLSKFSAGKINRPGRLLVAMHRGARYSETAFL
jgi:hypothetical protein